MTILYALISRDKTVLAEYTATSGKQMEGRGEENPTAGISQAPG